VAVTSDSGAAIIPAAINHSNGRAELLGELLFDYRDVLHAGAPEILPRTWQELTRFANGFHVVALSEAAVRDRWRKLPVTPFATAPQVNRALTDEGSFRAAHSRLGRQMRRLSKLGISQHNYCGNDSAVIRRLYENKRQHFASGDSNVFLDPRRCEFMVSVAALEGVNCELFTLEDNDGQIIAGLMTFRDHDIRRFYTIYFHPKWARYSPGLALLYEITARSLAEGLNCDYMTGEYPYKLRLSNASHKLFRLELEADEFRRTAERVQRTEAA